MISLARINRAFAEQFRSWLRDNKLSGMSAAFATGLEVSVATVNNWKRGLEPAPETLRRFFAHFPSEDPEEWVKLIEESNSIAA